MATLEDWQNWDKRNSLLRAMPVRIRFLLNCEIAQSVQSYWVEKYPNDKRPQLALDKRREWCLNPSNATHVITNDVANAYNAAVFADNLVFAFDIIIPNAGYAACAAASNSSNIAYTAYAACAAASNSSNIAYTAYAAASNNLESWKYSYALYLASLPIDWNPNWNTSSAIALARHIYKTGEFDTFPILADALQDADCYNEKLLSRLRDNSPKCRADVSICNLLGIG